MAKFRQGDLVLQSTQEIIQGVTSIIGANGAADFTLLAVSGASNLGVLDAGVTTLGSLGFSSGATINIIDTDTSLAADSDTRLATQKAIKTYVDAQIGGSVSHNSTQGLQGGDSTSVEYYHLTQAIHDALYSASPLIGLGDSAGNNLEVDYGGSADYQVALNNGLHSGGGLKIDLDDHIPESYYGVELSMVSTDLTGGSAYNYVEGMDIFVRLDSPDTTGIDRPDMVGAWIGTRASANYYGIVDGLDAFVRGDVGTTADYITGISNYAESRGTAGELAGVNTAMQVWSGTVGLVHGNWTLVQTWAGATIDDVFLYYGKYRDSGATINNDVWGIYIEDTDDVGMKNYLEGEVEFNINDNSTAIFEAELQIIGGTRAGGGSPRATLNINNDPIDDIQMSMGTDNHYYTINDVSGGEGSGVEHEWFVSGNSVASFDGLNQIIGDLTDTNVTVSQSGNSVTFEGANTTMAVFHPVNGLDFYHSGNKVAETTANGITGAVWG